MIVHALAAAPAVSLSGGLSVPHSLPYFGRFVQPTQKDAATFLRITNGECDALIAASDPASVIIVQYQAPWDTKQYHVGPILEKAAKRWPSATFYSTELKRGTPRGEHIFELHQSQGFKRMPLIQVFVGAECVDTLTLPQGEGGGQGAACPLFTEPGLVDKLQQAVVVAQQRANANARWRERRRVVLTLRRVRQDVRRLERFRASGKLTRRWESFKQGDALRDGRRASAPKTRRAERQNHLLGLASHMRDYRALRDEEARLERRRRLLLSFVLAAQRCSADGCAPVV